LWTDKPSLVRDGKITLIGPDIQESPGASLPFGQVLLVGGSSLGEEEHETLEQNQYVADQVEGYMIRSASQLVWSRVSKDAAGRGFCLETLGRALMAIFKSEVPKVQAVEIVFVTSSKEDLQPLDYIGAQVRKIAKGIVRETWKAKGIDILECTLGWDCGACPDKPVCDDIRELITVRKKQASED
jgi:CO dehydrogenase/acetyl-CoA synthase beta subunit